MSDLLLDRLGNRYLAYLYFSRVALLELIFASTILWAIAGWDGTFEQFFGGQYGVGFHWSTIQTLALGFWLLTVNMQTGGLNTLDDVWSAFKFDFRNMVRPLRFRKTRQEYAWGVVDGMRGILFAFFISILGAFVFENVWVLAYDYFQFGNVFWPIYNFGASFSNPNPFSTFILWRNVGLGFMLPLFFGPLILYGALIPGPNIWRKHSLRWFGFWLVGYGLRRKYSPRWRFDTHWLAIGAVTLSLWMIWISGIFPHSISTLSQLTMAQVVHLPGNYTLSGTWTFPAQLFFPQTTYTFYPARFYLHGYGPNQIFGFWVHDDFVHLLNVLTKYFTFLTVCYPALLRVKAN